VSDVVRVRFIGGPADGEMRDVESIPNGRVNVLIPRPLTATDYLMDPGLLQTSAPAHEVAVYEVTSTRDMVLADGTKVVLEASVHFRGIESA